MKRKIVFLIANVISLFFAVSSCSTSKIVLYYVNFDIDTCFSIHPLYFFQSFERVDSLEIKDKKDAYLFIHEINSLTYSECNAFDCRAKCIIKIKGNSYDVYLDYFHVYKDGKCAPMSKELVGILMKYKILEEDYRVDE